MAEETKKPETKEAKTEIKKEEKTGKEYIIPLRRKFSKTVSYHRTPKAIRAIKEFLVRHMKIYDKDLKKVKIEKSLNEFIWARGIKNPPAKIKVRAVVEGDFVRADLAELTEKLRFRKGKIEKREKEAAAIAPKKKEPEVPEKTETRPGVAKSEEETRLEKAKLEKEKKAAVVEAGQKIEKAAAKKMKFETKVSKQPKRQRRMALQK